jgi:hypothetical protein
LLKPSRAYFHFYMKSFLNSQAVRIRVKLVKNAIAVVITDLNVLQSYYKHKMIILNTVCYMIIGFQLLHSSHLTVNYYKNSI